MLEMYANQTATLGVQGTPNDYGESTYTTTTIKCRLEPVSKLIKNRDGQLVESSAWIATESVISLGNQINGRDIISVESQCGLNGAVEFYEGYLS